MPGSDALFEACLWRTCKGQAQLSMSTVSTPAQHICNRTPLKGGRGALGVLGMELLSLASCTSCGDRLFYLTDTQARGRGAFLVTVFLIHEVAALAAHGRPICMSFVLLWRDGSCDVIAFVTAQQVMALMAHASHQYHQQQPGANKP